MGLTAKEFELLLCEFCRQDLPLSFEIEHDIHELGDESGNTRQIDTKITGKIGVSSILICGEAKNWNDKVGSETIDGIVGKYLSGEIKANKVIVFSMKGFTKPAIERATKLGIELLEPAELGNPILRVPHIIAVGALGQMRVRISYDGPQKNLMGIMQEDYTFLKGKERISFTQNAKRHVVNKLKGIPRIDIHTDLSSVEFEDNNALYEIRQKEGYRYNGNFSVIASIIWIYHCEFLFTGVLHHINSEGIRLINLNGHPNEIFEKVLLSPTKLCFENKEELISDVLNENHISCYNLCFTDPNRIEIDPTNPLLEIVC